MAEKTQANPDKLKVLNAVMEKIEKDFGKGSIMRMNSSEVNDVQIDNYTKLYAHHRCAMLP